jgi:predicted transcriptional regulator
MPDSFPFPTYSGLLEPKHYNRIGSALWLFLWCISSTTKDIEKDGVAWGIVLGNKPIKREELAERFGVDEKTIRRWIKSLEEHGYIRVTRAPYGMVFTVRNSKKFQNDSDKNVHSPPERMDKNVHSGDREWAKMSTLLDKNVHSNKDITEDLKRLSVSELEIACAKENDHDQGDGILLTDPTEDEISPLKTIEDRFAERKGTGLCLSAADIEIIQGLIADGVPLETILTGTDDAFKNYKPRYKGDKIRNFSYCETVIRENYYREQVRRGKVDHAEANRRSEGSGGASPKGRSDEAVSKGKSGYYEQFEGLIQSL